MNFSRHPIYSALGMGFAVWLLLANARGWSLWHSAGPARWFSSHGPGGISHK